MNAQDLQVLGRYRYEETSVPTTSIDNVDKRVFGAYYRKVYESPLDESEIPLERLLVNMRLLVPDVSGSLRLSIAGLLLFGKKPQDALYSARISAVRWLGTEAGEEILDRKEITGRLPQQIDEAESFILRNTKLSTTITGVQQSDHYEYPRPAIREVLVNAVAHRDYSIEGAQILLYVFDDRIEIRSPGHIAK
jgi:ATP-dependent DNA helicase RecG